MITEYPFKYLHLHEEDAKWLRKRWDRYLDCLATIEKEREKEYPDCSTLNIATYNACLHKEKMIEFVRGRSKSVDRKLKKIFKD